MEFTEEKAKEVVNKPPMAQQKYPGFYISENILDYPHQMAITKLSFPRLFLRFSDDEFAMFSSYEFWRDNLIEVQWLDPSDKPTSKREIERILTDCWNFLAEHEAEEERIYEENMLNEDEE